MKLVKRNGKIVTIREIFTLYYAKWHVNGQLLRQRGKHNHILIYKIYSGWKDDKR